MASRADLQQVERVGAAVGLGSGRVATLRALLFAQFTPDSRRESQPLCLERQRDLNPTDLARRQQLPDVRADEGARRDGPRRAHPPAPAVARPEDLQPLPDLRWVDNKV